MDTTTKSKQQWKLWEDVDGCYVYPANADPDDLCFGRVKPVAKIADSDEAIAFIQYLSKLPAFRIRRTRRVSRHLALQREHEHQSNSDAVRSGSYIKGLEAR